MTYHIEKIERIGSLFCRQEAEVLLHYKQSKKHKKIKIKKLSPFQKDEYLFWDDLERTMAFDFSEEKQCIINKVLGYIKRADSRCS